MISCWTCSKTNNCKKMPLKIADVKSHVCEKYDPVPLEIVEARNTLVTAVGPLKAIKALKTHRSVSRMSVNPAVQKVIELVESGNTSAISAFRDDASVINSHLMIAACKVTDDPTAVSKQVAEGGADRRGKLIEILVSAASGRAPASAPATTLVAASAAETIAAVKASLPDAPAKRGRKPATATVAAADLPPEDMSAGTGVVIARLDAIGQGQDELSEKLSALTLKVAALTTNLDAALSQIDLLQRRLTLFKTAILNAELEMLGAGKLASAPFGETMEGWDTP